MYLVLKIDETGCNKTDVVLTDSESPFCDYKIVNFMDIDWCKLTTKSFRLAFFLTNKFMPQKPCFF